MEKMDPIIAVKDVESSSKWYQSLLGCKSKHGGQEFDVLVSEKDEVLICLHKWGEHEHPTLSDPDLGIGNGLILYFRTENMNQVHQNAKDMNCIIEDELGKNPNSGKLEFSLRDLDGYYLTISEYHKF